MTDAPDVGQGCRHDERQNDTEIIADGARPDAAAQQAQLEAWIAEHRVTWSGSSDLSALVAADEIDAYADADAADGFVSAGRGDEGRQLPQRQPGRAAQIAALYMFAHWLVAHPEVPMPTMITATYTVSFSDEPDQATRYAAVDQLAERLGCREYGREYGDNSPQFDLPIANPRVHGLEIIYRGTTHSDGFYGHRL